MERCVQIDEMEYLNENVERVKDVKEPQFFVWRIRLAYEQVPFLLHS